MTDSIIQVLPRNAKREPRRGEVVSFEYMADSILIDRQHALRQYLYLCQVRENVAARNWNYDHAREQASMIFEKLRIIEDAFGTQMAMDMIDLAFRRALRVLGMDSPQPPDGGSAA